MAHCRIQDTRASLSLSFAGIVIGQLGGVVPLVFEDGGSHLPSGKPAKVALVETVSYLST